MNQQNKRIAIFLSISLIWSLLWFSQKDLIFNFFGEIPPLLTYTMAIIPTLGLVITSIINRKNLPNKTMTLLGKMSNIALIIMVLPIILLAILGVKNTIGIQENLFGVIIGCITLCYAFCEEMGWRGYLDDELKSKSNKWLVYLFIGVVWYLWHWFFLRSGNDPKLIMLPLLIAASAGIGEVARATHSILICGALHGLANILLLYSVVAQNITTNQKLIILGVCLAVWIPLIKKVEKVTVDNS